MTIPEFTLNNGVRIPAVGFGVFQTPPDETIAAVGTALETGYRHIDTAAAYGNEREAGEAIRRSGLNRSEIFVETKVWINDYGYDETLHAFDKSAGKLGVEQIDLLILHQALPGEFDLTIAAYRALEELLANGKVRAIGVSNFMPEHLARLLESTSVVPAVNQIEVHPYFRQSELLAVDAEHGIVSQAWSPIGGITFYRDGSHGSTLADPTITKIAEVHGRTPAQVMLRWHLQRLLRHLRLPPARHRPAVRGDRRRQHPVRLGDGRRRPRDRPADRPPLRRHPPLRRGTRPHAR